MKNAGVRIVVATALVLALTAPAAADKQSYTLGGEKTDNTGVSLALHITLPLATSLVVDHLTENKSTTMLAFAAGMAVATAIDAMSLAKKQLSDRKWRPDLGFRDGGMQVKILAKF